MIFKKNILSMFRVQAMPHTKGHPPSADLRYGEEDSISPSTLIFAARKG